MKPVVLLFALGAAASYEGVSCDDVTKPCPDGFLCKGGASATFATAQRGRGGGANRGRVRRLRFGHTEAPPTAAPTPEPDGECACNTFESCCGPDGPYFDKC